MELPATSEHRIARILWPLLLMLLQVVACSDPAHDAATWAGAPWGLKDADLPDDQPSVIRWFRTVNGIGGIQTLPPFTIHDDSQVDMVVSYPAGTQGDAGAAPVEVDEHGLVCTPGCEVVLDDCAMSCTTTEVLRAAAETYDAVVVSIEPGAKVILVAAAIDIHSESGYEETQAHLWFADPGGSWVFALDGATVEDVRSLADALARSLWVTS
jgi:hypothetical protein